MDISEQGKADLCRREAGNATPVSRRQACAKVVFPGPAPPPESSFIRSWDNSLREPPRSPRKEPGNSSEEPGETSTRGMPGVTGDRRRAGEG
jgi:hypothetical protein